MPVNAASASGTTVGFAGVESGLREGSGGREGTGGALSSTNRSLLLISGLLWDLRRDFRDARDGASLFAAPNKSFSDARCSNVLRFDDFSLPGVADLLSGLSLGNGIGGISGVCVPFFLRENKDDKDSVRRLDFLVDAVLVVDSEAVRICCFGVLGVCGSLGALGPGAGRGN